MSVTFICVILPGTLSFIQRLHSNTPALKPELWDNVPRALWRAFCYRIWCSSCVTNTNETRVTGYDSTLRMVVAQGDQIGRAIFVYGIYEYAVTKFIDAYLEPGMAFADLGANRGYYTFLAAKRVGNSGKVYSFEPVERLFRDLQTGIQLNCFSNIEAHQLAICSEEGTRRFFVQTTIENSGLSSLLQRAELGSELQAQMVQTTSLDLFFQGGRKLPQLMKVDVEGAEAEVFCGGASILSSASTTDFIFEYNTDLKAQNILSGMGYSIFEIGWERKRGIILAPFQADPPKAFTRYFESRNLFATKTLRAKLQSIML